MSRTINEIIVHCSATRPEWMAGRHISSKIEEITRWHRARGFSDIGYHWIIDRDGAIARGRDEKSQGAHVLGRNGHSIGVCLLGGHGSESTDDFEDHFTSAQDDALRKLLQEIEARHPGVAKISGHNEYANKACPGFIVQKWLDSKPKPVVSAPRPSWLDALIAWLRSFGK